MPILVFSHIFSFSLSQELSANATTKVAAIDFITFIFIIVVIFLSQILKFVIVNSHYKNIQKKTEKHYPFG